MAYISIDVFIGNRIRLRRTEIGSTQQAVAQKLGITFQQIQKYENGSNAVNSIRLYELSKALFVPIDYFFCDMDGNDLIIEKNGISEDNTPNEVIDVMECFNRIPNKLIRKRIADFIRSLEDL